MILKRVEFDLQKIEATSSLFVTVSIYFDKDSVETQLFILYNTFLLQVLFLIVDVLSFIIHMF